MSDNISRFTDVMKYGCPELEHIGGPIEKLETEWARRFTQMSNTLAASGAIQKTAFDIAKQTLLEQVRTHQVPNGQLWEMRHPVWEAYDCGLVCFDMTEDGVEFIDMQTITIQGLRSVDYFADKRDVDYSGDELSFFQIELIDGEEATVRLEDKKLETATDKNMQCAAIGSLLTTLSFVKLEYLVDSQPR